MKTYKKALCFLMTLTIFAVLTACGSPSADYLDAASFEAALNSGENLGGKTVQFTADEVIPNSALGYNVQAGEHLNFISSTNPGIKKGDIVTVKANTIVSLFGSWLIQYEKLSSKAGSIGSAESTTQGVTSNPGNKSTAPPDSTTSFFTPEPAESPQPLELVDHGFSVSSISEDTAYMDFCGMIYNPNETFIASFPKILATVKNSDGTILATDDQGAFTVMPGDTITLCGSISIPTAGIDDSTSIYFDLEWSDMTTSTYRSGARTTDFSITNVSEQNSSRKNLITGEITNNYFEDVDSVNLSVILRKNGEIVYIENTFVHNLKVGNPKAFQLSSYQDWPEHDTIEVSAMAW